MAFFAAILMASGTSKGGCPMLRFMGSFNVFVSSNIFRIPDNSILLVRSASNDSGNTEVPRTSYCGYVWLTIEAQRAQRGEAARKNLFEPQRHRGHRD